MAQTTPSLTTKSIKHFFSSPVVALENPAIVTPSPTLALCRKDLKGSPAKRSNTKPNGIAGKLKLPKKNVAKVNKDKLNIQVDLTSESPENIHLKGFDGMEVSAPSMEGAAVEITVENMEVSAPSMESAAVEITVENNCDTAYPEVINADMNDVSVTDEKETTIISEHIPAPPVIVEDITNPKVQRPKRTKQIAKKALKMSALESQTDGLEFVSSSDNLVPPDELIPVDKSCANANQPTEQSIVDPESKLPLAVREKIRYNRQKAKLLADELIKAENSDCLSSGEYYSDINWNSSGQELVAAIVDVVRTYMQAHENDVLPPLANVAESILPDSEPTNSILDCSDSVVVSFSKCLTCIIQGSRFILSELSLFIVQKLQEILREVVSQMQSTTDGQIFNGDSIFLRIKYVLLEKYRENRCTSMLMQVLTCIENDDVGIAKQIVESVRQYVIDSTNRECYGYRTKDSIAFENSDVLSLWAWEITSISLLSDTDKNVIRDRKANRRRYGTTIKAILGVVEQLVKTPDVTDARVLQREEKSSRACAELEKAKERMLEILKKKESDKHDKLKREEEKRLRQLEKEQVVAKKKEEAQLEMAAIAEKKRLQEEAVLAEKKLMEERENKKLEKQRHLLQNFLVTTSNSLKCEKIIENANSASCAPNDRKEICKKREFDEAIFERELHDSNISSSDVFRYYRERFRNPSQNQPRKRRKFAKLSVTVAVNHDNAFATESYSEIRDVYVDNRMKLFRFHDYNTARYWGTFSKKSKIVNGRRPFVKDIANRNYDVDSAEEWEEEEEDGGEDIIDSDEDNDDGCDEPNDLVYDDFFRHDDDFGSDAEGENYGGVNGMPGNVSKKSSTLIKTTWSGPRFIWDSPLRHDTKVKLDADVMKMSPMKGEASPFSAWKCGNDGKLSSCSNLDVDVSRLLPYYTVVYPQICVQADCSAVTNELVSEINMKSEIDRVASNVEESIVLSQGEKLKGMSKLQLITLANFVHGQKCGIEKLVEKFKQDCPDLSKAQIARSIKEIAERAKGDDGVGSVRWIVRRETIESNQLQLSAIEFTPVKKKARRITPTVIVPILNDAEKDVKLECISEICDSAIETVKPANDLVFEESPQYAAQNNVVISDAAAMSSDLQVPTHSQPIQSNISKSIQKTTLLSFFKAPKSSQEKAACPASNTPGSELSNGHKTEDSPVEKDIFDRLSGGSRYMSDTPLVVRSSERNCNLPVTVFDISS